MAQNRGVYKCDVCGNIVEVLTAGGADLMCCGQAMTLQAENTTDAAVEKHVPVIEKQEGGYKVAVGSVDHPMTDAHFIEWIDLTVGNATYRQFLTPSDKPEAFFPVTEDGATARAYCNLHGLWKS